MLCDCFFYINTLQWNQNRSNIIYFLLIENIVKCFDQICHYICQAGHVKLVKIINICCIYIHIIYIICSNITYI